MSSNPDTFIDEVTEAVRRDRLFLMFRRYGWIGALLIVAIVGASAWTQWTRHSAEMRAQAFGDRVDAALAETDAAAQAQALAAIEPETPGQRALLTLLSATTPETAAGLEAVRADQSLAPVYRDLAEFRLLLLSPDLSEEERVRRFEALTAPGAPFRLLAEEQLALIDVAAGRGDEAIARLQRLAEDNAASAALRQRASQLIVALGGTPKGQTGN